MGSGRLAAWAEQLWQAPALLGLAGRADVISFALGLPASDLFPVAAWSEAVARTARDPATLQYGLPVAGLTAPIAELMHRRGVREARATHLTQGSQQAMSLVVQLLVNPGDTVVVEHRTYPGFRKAVAPRSPRLLGVPTSSSDGLDVDVLEALLRGGERPKLVYIMTDGHNPLGTSLRAAARTKLLELADAYDFLILEDDAYGHLQYASSTECLFGASLARVIYCGSFSKILAPALRIGWLCGPPELHTRLSFLKDGQDVDTGTFAQHALASMLDSFDLQAHLSQLCSAYRERRDRMLHALARTMPDGVRWSAPECGMFVWLELPTAIDTTELYGRALTEGVAYMPGETFAPDPAHPARHCMRLSFASRSLDDIDRGIARLGGVIDAALGR